MRRRKALALAAAPALLLQGCAAAEVRGFPTLAAARVAVEAVAAGGWRSTGAFNLAQTLHHAAQSVEFSRLGFPQLKPAAFRHTVGRAAFVWFDSRGAMSHGLDEPIPGAPALAAGDALQAAGERLLKALRDFENHSGALAPHFAYGVLDKLQYTRAHLMHLANHWTEVVRV